VNSQLHVLAALVPGNGSSVPTAHEVVWTHRVGLEVLVERKPPNHIGN
jgi:hypothetical protein